MPARDQRNRELVGCGLKAAAFPSGFGLVTAEPPLKVGKFPLSVCWRRRKDADPRTVWKRE
jgi:hypothetical protein